MLLTWRCCSITVMAGVLSEVGRPCTPPQPDLISNLFLCADITTIEKYDIVVSFIFASYRKLDCGIYDILYRLYHTHNSCISTSSKRIVKSSVLRQTRDNALSWWWRALLWFSTSLIIFGTQTQSVLKRAWVWRKTLVWRWVLLRFRWAISSPILTRSHAFIRRMRG